ncbi:C2 family cysteine protease [Janibacter limosus]|uniref:C2 family cysteine protease n=1 Tax=Janibacter limosus TaxID=53458 RepID=UPI000A5CC785|nr:C2 family cysteine protease [Janibacter limosus]
MTVSDGMDVARIRGIAAQLRGQGEVMTGVAEQGRASLAVLEGAWSGDDLLGFSHEWTGAERAAHSAADMVRDCARTLDRQAEDQDDGSAGDGSAGRWTAPTAPGEESGQSKEKDNPNYDPDRGSAEDTEIKGPLFRDGVSPTDVEQGSLNDCWFIASMQSIAATDPDVIERNITDNGDGTYDVTLYRDGEPVTYRVDATLPAHGQNPVFADNSSSDERELWPLLYEKAMAQHMGGSWDDMDFDTAAQGLEAITGRDVDSHETGDGGFLGFGGAPDIDEMREILDNNGQIMLDSHDTIGDRPLYEDDTIAKNHMYWVKGITDDGQLQIVNPWDPSAEPIEMSYDDYKDNFSHVNTVQP